MIQFLDILSFILECLYVFVFFWILHTFLPVRKNWIVRVLAVFFCSFLAGVIVYSNDLANLLGTLIGFCIYLIIFHRGRWVEKLTAVLIFYPAVIAVNYMMQDIGSNIFFGLTGDNIGDNISEWPPGALLLSTGIHTATLLARLLFWTGAWLFLRKYLKNTTYTLTNRMWLIVDTLMLASVVSIFTIIYFMPERMIIVYPICTASIFSSFGCIYLASYMCSAMQTAWHAQELEMRQAYYEEKMEDETRIRRIYHDMKNHLLVLENAVPGAGAAVPGAENVPAGGRPGVTGNASAGGSLADSGQTASYVSHGGFQGPGVRASIEHLQQQIASYENYYRTGNAYLDVIIRDKAKTAREKQIDFTAVIHFEDGAFLDPLDISTIFGNALDNAIEASEKLAIPRRVITVKSRRIHDMMVIAVENNALPGADTSGRTTKEDSFLHGFGLSNIKSTAEKYDGQCTVKCEGGIFVLKIIIPVP